MEAFRIFNFVLAGLQFMASGAIFTSGNNQLGAVFFFLACASLAYALL